MTKIKTHCFHTLGVLAILYLSAAVSVAQKPTESAVREPSQRTESAGKSVQLPIDPFAVLPAADALIVVDLKRFSSEAVPRLLVDEQDARALVFALPGQEPIELLDRLPIERMVIGLRYSKRPDEKSEGDFEFVTVAQSGEAVQLPALIRSKGSDKYREQGYAGKILYITQSEQTEPKGKTTAATSSEESEWAIVALNANTFVFGQPADVRASIDVSAGKGTAVSSELVAEVKRSPKALLSAAGQLPPSFGFAELQMENSDLSQVLSSLKRFYASVELIPTGFDVAVTLNTTSPEQTKSVVDLLVSLKTLFVTLTPVKTRQDKMVRDLFKGLVISPNGSEVQIRNEITQASVDEIVKQTFADLYFYRGVAQVEKADSHAAIAEFNKAIVLVPDNALTFIDRGKAWASKGSFAAAIADYDKAISLDPDNAHAYNVRCFARVKKEDIDAAIVDCDKAIALDPNFAVAYNNRGAAFAFQGKLDKALVDYDKSIALGTEIIVVFQNRGDTRLELGNYDGAIADFEKVITANANSAAYNGRGLARYYKGDFDQAIADYDKALALDPDAASTYNNRAMALEAKGNADKALADYDKSIALNDKDDSVYSNRGDLRSDKGDWNGAIADFDKAIALNPKSASAYNGRGLTRYSKEEFDQAIADFDKAIAIDPIATFYLNRGYARHQKSDLERAIADFDKAISLEPKLAEAYNARGLAHFDNANIDQAMADYDKVIAIEPTFAPAYGNRALSLLALGRDAQAEKDLNKCFALDESLRSVFDSLVEEIKKTRRTKPRKHH